MNEPHLRSNQVEAEKAVTEMLEAGSSVLLVGPPGIGKSAMVRWILANEPVAKSNVVVNLGPDAKFEDLQADSEVVVVVEDLDNASTRDSHLRGEIAKLLYDATGGKVRVLATARNAASLPEELRRQFVIVEMTGDSPLFDYVEPRPLDVFVDPGNASVETLQAFFSALSDLQAAAGGLGLEFHTDDQSTFTVVEVQQ